MVSVLSVSACVSLPLGLSLPWVDDAPDERVRIAPITVLTLPLPPNYPNERTLTQVVRGRRDDVDRAFECVVFLSPAQVEVVVTAAGGPRLSTITWNAEGIEEERTALAPQGLPVENILADLFVSLWPVETVAASLPEGVTIRADADGGRTILRGDTPLMEVRPDPANPARATLRNLAFDYELTVVSRDVE